MCVCVCVRVCVWLFHLCNIMLPPNRCLLLGISNWRHRLLKKLYPMYTKKCFIAFGSGFGSRRFSPLIIIGVMPLSTESEQALALKNSGTKANFEHDPKTLGSKADPRHHKYETNSTIGKAIQQKMPCLSTDFDKVFAETRDSKHHGCRGIICKKASSTKYTTPDRKAAS